MSKARIQIIIPTCESVDLIDQTMESIQMQNYDIADIYIIIVDFGSTDGTYEKVLKYDRYHLGVYQKTGQRNRRQMITEAARIGIYTNPESAFCFRLVLYPGDVMYPDCLRICADSFIEKQAFNPSVVIFETDICNEKGVIHSQQPMFATERIIDGKTEINQYIETGFRHQIAVMCSSYSTKRYREAGERNEHRWWNKCARGNNEQNAIYLPISLMCAQAVTYEDELEEILLRWESIIVQIRAYESKFGSVFDKKFEEKAKKNLSYYALWRSYLILQKKGDKKASEDCYLIAGVINNQIKESDIYSKFEMLFLKKDDSQIEGIGQFFDQNGMI